MRKISVVIASLALAGAVGAIILNHTLRTGENAPSVVLEKSTGGSSTKMADVSDDVRTEQAAARTATAATQSAVSRKPSQSLSTDDQFGLSGSSDESRRSTSEQAPSRTPSDRFPGDSEMESFRRYRNSDYDSYDKDTLLALAETGDAQALAKLFEKVGTKKLCELAGVSFRSGHPMAYGVATDLVLATTKDRILARAYYYAWRQSGSDLAMQFEGDYLKRTAMSSEENQRAIALSQQLQVNNDCGWASGS